MGQTDRTRCFLRHSRSKNLQHIVPVQMLVSIHGLLLVVAVWFDNEAVICVDISKPISEVHQGDLAHPPRLINGMMAGSDPINIAPPSTPTHCVPSVLRSRREGEVHEMGDGGLTPPTVGISHGSLSLLAPRSEKFVTKTYGFSHSILIR
jgi:hypothetical protein